MFGKLTFKVLISALLLVGLVGCGVKGPLEPPAGSKGTSGETGAGTPGTSEEKQHDPFVLDKILR
ncbi:MAG: LPS translocon maturation chaperone LptM [Methyloligellaceae bacterium]